MLELGVTLAFAGVVLIGVFLGELYGTTLLRFTLCILLVAVTPGGFDTIGRIYELLRCADDVCSLPLLTQLLLLPTVVLAP